MTFVKYPIIYYFSKTLELFNILKDFNFVLEILFFDLIEHLYCIYGSCVNATAIEYFSKSTFSKFLI